MPSHWAATSVAAQFYFFAARLGISREGTDWEKVLRLLTLCRLLSPGSEWRLRRHGFHHPCADLLGADERLAQDDPLYRGLAGLPAHKHNLFARLRQRWRDFLGTQFDVLLYDLTKCGVFFHLIYP